MHNPVSRVELLTELRKVEQQRDELAELVAEKVLLERGEVARAVLHDAAEELEAQNFRGTPEVLRRMAERWGGGGMTYYPENACRDIKLKHAAEMENSDQAPRDRSSAVGKLHAPELDSVFERRRRAAVESPPTSRAPHPLPTSSNGTKCFASTSRAASNPNATSAAAVLSSPSTRTLRTVRTRARPRSNTCARQTFCV